MQPLKYLFKATYKDGRVYQQNVDDRSCKEPEKRSCYFDIANDISELASFVLKGDGHEYGVDLIDGHFEIDGVAFTMHDPHITFMPNGQQIATPLTNFRLIFFRNHTHSFNTYMEDGTYKETDHQITYRMGWECNVEGVEKPIKRIMQIK